MDIEIQNFNWAISPTAADFGAHLHRDFWAKRHFPFLGTVAAAHEHANASRRGFTSNFPEACFPSRPVLIGVEEWLSFGLSRKNIFRERRAPEEPVTPSGERQRRSQSGSELTSGGWRTEA
jgi:hypothetical protein